MVGALFACFFMLFFLILWYARIVISLALSTVFLGFSVPQLFQVSKKLSVCFQSQRPSFFLSSFLPWKPRFNLLYNFQDHSLMIDTNIFLCKQIVFMVYACRSERSESSALNVRTGSAWSRPRHVFTVAARLSLNRSRLEAGQYIISRWKAEAVTYQLQLFLYHKFNCFVTTNSTFLCNKLQGTSLCGVLSEREKTWTCFSSVRVVRCGRCPLRNIILIDRTLTMESPTLAMESPSDFIGFCTTSRGKRHFYWLWTKKILDFISRIV